MNIEGLKSSSTTTNLPKIK